MNKLISIGLVLAFAVATVTAFDQPFMKAARTDLNQALNAMKRATADKGGHREKAIDLINRAIGAVNDGIAYDERNPNNRPRRNDTVPGSDTTFPVADQPNMKIAKGHLQNALTNLEKATADKGGHRANAIRLVREAIEEIERGIAYDRNN